MRDHYDFSKGIIGKYAGKIAHNVRLVREDAVKDTGKWRDPSVRLLAGDRDPVETIVGKARQIVLEAVDSIALSVPIDPFKLAEHLSIRVNPRNDIPDARTICGPQDEPVIEYNPNRPRARIRFSICHELGHTLFPDCVAQVRNRLYHSETSSGENELEMLCNLAAAEFLLPIGSIQEDISKLDLSIDSALDLRPKYEASVEAILLRLAAVSGTHCAVFAAVTEEAKGNKEPRHRLEYVRAVQNWESGLKRGDFLPSDSAANGCTAIGFTAKSEEEWVPDSGKFKIEMVGVSPYPNRHTPRIVGLIKPLGKDVTDSLPIKILRGDALQPRGVGKKILAHVVNDKTPNWGAGFGKATQMKWPEAQRGYRQFFEQTRGSKLGLTTFSRVTDDLTVFQMICQHGYGQSPTPRLRYGALRQCLETLRGFAVQEGASVHMPRIGTGEAGGSWPLIANLITEELCARGVSVTVYDLPNKAPSRRIQTDLFELSYQ